MMKEEEEDLPSPEDLIPVSQSLITPDLALAFNIPAAQQTASAHAPPQQPLSLEFDSSEVGGPSGGDELARTLKRPRLVWTPQLHKRFVDAVAHLGIKNAVPKTIMQLMSVDGLTRENVASHLQKYRLYLKRMQGMSNSGGSEGPSPGMDPATDHLFASSPVPPHFLHPNRANSDLFIPFVPPHHHQIRVAPPPANQFRHIGNVSPPNGQFELHFLRPAAAQVSATNTSPARPPEDLETGNNGRKVLTLFPTWDDS